MRDFAVFAAQDRESPYKVALYEQVLAPLIPTTNDRQGRRAENQADNSYNGNRAAIVSMAMKLSDKLPHEITYDDIMRASHYEGDALSNSISAVFATYKVEQFIWAHSKIESELVSFDELINEYRAKYRPPWETFREILSAMRDASEIMVSSTLTFPTQRITYSIWEITNNLRLRQK